MVKVSSTRLKHSWAGSKRLLWSAIAVLTAALLSSWLATKEGTRKHVIVDTYSDNLPTVSVAKTSSEEAVIYRERLHGVDVLWQAPLLQTNPRDPCGILVALHGCHHSATDFWSNDEAGKACSGECLGLPEERAIVRLGLDRGLIVVALSSQNRKSGCWSVARDKQPVDSVLREFRQRWSQNGDTALPIIAFGASSGGHLVQQLDTVDAFIAQIAPAFPRPPQQDGPPTQSRCGVYITMNRDKRVDESVADAVNALHNSDKDNYEHTRLPDLALDEAFFTERIGGDLYSLVTSKQMTQALRDSGFLDANNKLVDDPGRSNWRPVLRPFVPVEHDSFQPNQSPVSEVLRVAYGKHEMTRDGVAQAVDFCWPLLDKSVTCGAS